jgi:hypothetical protein
MGYSGFPATCHAGASRLSKSLPPWESYSIPGLQARPVLSYSRGGRGDGEQERRETEEQGTRDHRRHRTEWEDTP